MSEILDRMKTAEQQASIYAPPPAYDPTHAGVAGLFAVGAVLSLFTTLAGIDRDRFLFAAVVMLALGFGLPYLYFWDQRRRHTAAFVRELANLRGEQEPVRGEEISN